MKLVFCFAGKTFRGAHAELVDLYEKRLSRFCPVEIIEAKTLKAQSRPGTHIMLDPAGRTMGSEQFAAFIEEQMNRGTRHLFFYTGAAEGFDHDVNREALKISFSPMTFNHQLIRIMLMEQVYRAFTIIRGEPYHK